MTATGRTGFSGSRLAPAGSEAVPPSGAASEPLEEQAAFSAPVADLLDALGALPAKLAKRGAGKDAVPAAYTIIVTADGAYASVGDGLVRVVTPIRNVTVEKPGTLSIPQRTLAASWKYISTARVRLVSSHTSKASQIICEADNGAYYVGATHPIGEPHYANVLAGESGIEAPCSTQILRAAVRAAAPFVATKGTAALARLGGVTLAGGRVFAANETKGIIIESKGLPAVAGWLPFEACDALDAFLRHEDDTVFVAAADESVRVRRASGAALVAASGGIRPLDDLAGPTTDPDVSFEAKVPDLKRALKIVGTSGSKRVNLRVDAATAHVVLVHEAPGGRSGSVPVEATSITGTRETPHALPVDALGVIIDRLAAGRARIELRHVQSRLLVSSVERIVFDAASGTPREEMTVQRFVLLPPQPPSR